MGFTLQDFENKANEDHKGLTVDGDDGQPLFTLRSSLRLNDAETAKLNAAHEKLEDYQKDPEPDANGNKVARDIKTSEMRSLVGGVLCALSDSPQRTKEFLRSADLALHMAVLTMYREQTQAAEGN